MEDIRERIKKALEVRGMMPVLLISTNRPLDFIAFQAVFIFLWANFGQKKNPTAYAMG